MRYLTGQRHYRLKRKVPLRHTLNLYTTHHTNYTIYVITSLKNQVLCPLHFPSQDISIYSHSFVASLTGLPDGTATPTIAGTGVASVALNCAPHGEHVRCRNVPVRALQDQPLLSSRTASPRNIRSSHATPGHAARPVEETTTCHMVFTKSGAKRSVYTVSVRKSYGK